MAKKKNKKKRSKSNRKQQSQTLLQRIKKGQQKSAGSKTVIAKDVQRWNPKDGNHIIDIIPYAAGKNDPDTKKGEQTYTFQYYRHRNVGPANAVLICLAETFNKPCPICEDRQNLRDKGADEKLWKPLFPKLRNLYNVICYDRGEEEKGVQVWDVPFFYSEKNLLAIASKPQRDGSVKFINFPSLDVGKTVSFKITPPASKNDYATYEGFSFDDRDYDVDEDAIEDAQVLDEIVHVPSYKEIKKVHFSSKKEEEEEEEDNGETGGDIPLVDSDELMELLGDCEDLDDLEDFADDNDFDVKINKRSKFRKVKRELEALVLALVEEEDDGGNGDDYSWGEIKKMKKKELKKLIKEEDLDVDPDDAEDLDDLREMVGDELDITY